MYATDVRRQTDRQMSDKSIAKYPHLLINQYYIHVACGICNTDVLHTWQHLTFELILTVTLALTLTVTLLLTRIRTVMHTNLPNNQNISTFQFVNMPQCPKAGEQCSLIGCHGHSVVHSSHVKSLQFVVSNPVHLSSMKMCCMETWPTEVH